MATFMPRAAKRLAAARPMPLAPPVMTALRPEASAEWSGMAGLLLNGLSAG